MIKDGGVGGPEEEWGGRSGGGKLEGGRRGADLKSVEQIPVTCECPRILSAYFAVCCPSGSRSKKNGNVKGSFGINNIAFSVK